MRFSDWKQPLYLEFADGWSAVNERCTLKLPWRRCECMMDRGGIPSVWPSDVQNRRNQVEHSPPTKARVVLPVLLYPDVVYKQCMPGSPCSPRCLSRLHSSTTLTISTRLTRRSPPLLSLPASLCAGGCDASRGKPPGSSTVVSATAPKRLRTAAVMHSNTIGTCEWFALRYHDDNM